MDTIRTWNPPAPSVWDWFMKLMETVRFYIICYLPWSWHPVLFSSWNIFWLFFLFLLGVIPRVAVMLFFFFPFAFFVDRKRKQDQKHLVFWRLLVFEVLIKLYSLLLCYIKRRGKGKCWKRLVKIEKSVFFFPGFTFVFFFLIITCNSALHQAIIAESLSRKKSWRKRHLYCERVHFLSPFLC